MTDSSVEGFLLLNKINNYKSYESEFIICNMKVLIEFDSDKCIQYLCKDIISKGGSSGVNKITNIALNKTDKDIFRELFNVYLTDKGIIDYKFL